MKGEVTKVPSERKRLKNSEFCYRLNCVLPSKYAGVLTTSTSECDLVWRQGLTEVIKLKEGH